MIESVRVVKVVPLSFRFFLFFKHGIWMVFELSSVQLGDFNKRVEVFYSQVFPIDKCLSGENLFCFVYI